MLCLSWINLKEYISPTFAVINQHVELSSTFALLRYQCVEEHISSIKQVLLKLGTDISLLENIVA